MNYFHVAPNTLRAEREALDAVYRSLCQDMAEVSRVIQELATMTSFDEPIEVLLRTQRKASGQEVKLRQCISVLGIAADLYTWTEVKNVDGRPPPLCPTSVRPGPGRLMYALTSIPEPPALDRTQEMLPDARSYFGMDVIIPQSNNRGGG